MNDLTHALSVYAHQPWIIAVSGGPDSMALLRLAHLNQVRCVMVHINYHHRPSATRDQDLVVGYCLKHDIPYVVFDAFELTGNFQDAARRFRYEKFAEVCRQHQALGVLVAHHREDDAETLKIQLDRKSQVTRYGLTQSTIHNKIRIDRPLLTFSKADLISLCVAQQIDFGIDETNLEDTYLRNRIRKTLTPSEIDALLKQKESLNEALDRFKARHQELLNLDPVSIDALIHLKYPVLFLSLWCRAHLSITALSDDHVNELYRQIRSGRNFVQNFGDKRLVKQYGQIWSLSANPSYTYLLKEAQDLVTPYFTIRATLDDPQGFAVCDQDFPLTIRNVLTEERFLIHGESRSLSRWFIRHKIPLKDRESWPVVVNASGEVIHIHRIKFARAHITPKTVLVMLK